MPQKPFNLGTDSRGVFKGQGLSGPGGFADVLSNRAQEVEKRQSMGSIFNMNAKQLQEYAKPIEGFIGPLVSKLNIKLLSGANRPVNVLKNPTKEQVRSFTKNTKWKATRGLETDSGDLYVFDAEFATHEQIKKALKEIGESPYIDGHEFYTNYTDPLDLVDHGDSLVGYSDVSGGEKLINFDKATKWFGKTKK